MRLVLAKHKSVKNIDNVLIIFWYRTYLVLQYILLFVVQASHEKPYLPQLMLKSLKHNQTWPHLNARAATIYKYKTFKYTWKLGGTEAFCSKFFPCNVHGRYVKIWKCWETSLQTLLWCRPYLYGNYGAPRHELDWNVDKGCSYNPKKIRKLTWRLRRHVVQIWLLTTKSNPNYFQKVMALPLETFRFRFRLVGCSRQVYSVPTLYRTFRGVVDQYIILEYNMSGTNCSIGV